MKLRDPDLLRTPRLHRREVGRTPTTARTHAVVEPRDRREDRHRAGHGCGRNAARHRGRERAPSRRGRRVPPRSARSILRRWYELLMANQEDLATLMTAEQGKPLAEAQGRDRLRGLLHRVVRRGRQAPVRRHDSGPPGRQAPAGAAPAGGCGRRDHALEFPARHDHAQGGPGARGRLHLRRASRPRQTPYSALAPRRSGRARRRAGRGAQHRHRRGAARSAAR